MTDAEALLDGDDEFPGRPVATSRKKKPGKETEIVLPPEEEINLAEAMSEDEIEDDDLESEVELSDDEDADDDDFENEDDDDFEDVDEDDDEDDDDIDDEEDGEVIDGSEDDISNLENDDDPTDADDDDAVDYDPGTETRDPAVAAAVRAVQQASANKKRTVPMADAKKMTKADAIRTTIAKMKADGKTDIRPKDVIAALAKRGIEVTSPQVSVTLSNWDKQGAKTAKAAAAPKAPTAKVAKPAAPAPKEEKRATAKVRSTTPAAEGRGPEYHALMAAGDFVRTAGGVSAARELLDAYEQLLDNAG